MPRFPSKVACQQRSCRQNVFSSRRAVNSKFGDTTAEHVVAYALAIKAELLRHLAPLLQDGLSTPCLRYRHQPVLLFDASLLLTEQEDLTPMHGRDAGREFVLEQRLLRTASAVLGFRGQVFNDFERFMHEDMAHLRDMDMLLNYIQLYLYLNNTTSLQ